MSCALVLDLDDGVLVPQNHFEHDLSELPRDSHSLDSFLACSDEDRSG